MEAAALPTTELVGAWVSIFLTLCILSFLYADNPIYKLAEHLFLGVSIAVSFTEQFYGVIKPNLVDKLAAGNLLSLLPLALSIMLLLKLHRRFDWVARIPIAFLVAAYAGVKITGEANANLMTQAAQSMPDFGELWRQHGLWSWEADGAGVISGVVLLAGLAACLLHFYFSAPPNRTMAYVSRFGVLVLMLSFGASFGYTVMGRISLAIGRAQELLGLDKAPAVVEQIQPRVASVVCAALIVAMLVAWRVGEARKPPPA